MALFSKCVSLLKTAVFSVLLALFCVLLCSTALAAPDKQAIEAPAANMPPSSIYSWSPYAFAPESSNGALFEALNVRRVYQSFGSDYAKVLKSQDTVDAIADLKSRGIEVYLLCGMPKWGMYETELQKPMARIDAIREYNESIGKEAPIKGIVFDIESHTTDEWKADRPAGFRTYINNMKALYDYAKANNVEVIQCIARTLDNVSTELLGEYIRDCCDELSVMNYQVGKEVKGIENEVAYCRQHGKRIESVFNTMPPNGGSITEDITYYGRTFADILGNWDQLEQAYGEDKVGMCYHHFQNVVPVLADGGLIADIAAYTSEDDPARDALGQSPELKSIVLKGSDGTVITAGLYHPSLPTSASGFAYLAIGVRPGIAYTVESGDPEHYKVLTKNPHFELDGNGITLSATIRIEPGSESFVEEGQMPSSGDTPTVSDDEDGKVLDAEPPRVDDVQVDDSQTEDTPRESPKTEHVVKAPNKLAASARVKTLVVKFFKLKNRAQVITKAKAFKVSGAKGKVSFAKASGNKKITVSKSGKLTLKKGLKRGAYTVKVKVTAAGDVGHLKVTKTVKLKIRVL